MQDERGAAGASLPPQPASWLSHLHSTMNGDRSIMNGDGTRSATARGKPGRKLLRGGAYLLAGVVLAGAATLAGVRVLLPELGHYRPEIERWLSRISDRRVEIGTIDAHWRGWTPVFRLGDVRLAEDGTPAGAPADPSIRLADLSFSMDPLEALRSGSFRPREIAASGASVVVVRRADGTFAVGGAAETAPGGARSRGGLVPWLLSQAEISLFASRILWIDERYGPDPLPLEGVTLHLEHAGDRRRISGSFEPSGAGRVDFAMEMEGAAPPSSWSGTAYLAARDVDVARLGFDPGRQGTHRLSGVISAKVWSTWRDGRPVEAEGTMQARSPGLIRGGIRRGFDEVGASFKAERAAEGWTLAVRDLVVATPRGSWPPSGVDAMWIPPRHGRDGAVVVKAGVVRLEDLAALAAPSRESPADAMLSALIEADPQGAIEDLHVSVPVTDRVEIHRAAANGRFTGLRAGSDAWPVSVDAASGRFEASEQGFFASIASGSLRVDAPSWLVRPLRGEKLTGTLAAIPTPEGIRVRLDEASLATAAGTVAAEGWMLARRDESEPELSVALSLGPSRIADVRDLLAGRAMPEPLARWLESAAPYGDLHEGRLAFRGRLSPAPFGDGAGRLEATGKLVVPLLDYAPGWPEITNLSAAVRLDGRRLDARIESGRILKSTIREAEVTVEDMGAGVRAVRIEGRVEGATANAVRFLSESPLRARFGPMLDGVTIQGDSAIDLQLAIPLGKSDGAIGVDGRVALDHNRLDVRGLRRGLSAVNGVIAFRNAAVESDGITAIWLDEPIRMAIGASPETPYATRLSIDGRLTRRLLAAYLRDAGIPGVSMSGDSRLLARIRGDATWNATLDIAPSEDGTAAKLHLASDLTGLALDLPPPFGKESGTARRLGVDTRIAPGEECIAEVRLGALASAVLRLVPDADGFRFDRGAIRVGDDHAALPDAPGLTLRGAVPGLDVDAWRAVLEDVEALGPPSPDAPRFDLVREVSIDADSVTVLGARFPETGLQATRGADGGWRLDLDGDGAKGVVRVPSDPHAGPLDADFEHLILAPETDDAGSEPSSLDPRTLPALSFSARRFVLGGYDFGRIGLTATPFERGLKIERLAVRTDSFAGEATGSWSLDGAEHRTEFDDLRMYEVDLGRTLGTLGFDDRAVSGGTTHISMRGAWKGSPADFALDRLTGVMHFRSTEGRLIQVDPNLTGRVFGLLTITSLPRRLILDFRDLFKDGFEYDRIEGSFAIEKGNAYTDDLFMEGDTARFEVVGRSGFVNRDYDNRVTVIPKISSILPLVPIWIAQKIFDSNVFDKAFSYQYTITGPWDEPLVEFVKAEPREDSTRQQ